jgi:alkylation response protein AidB-like acyl-CoA dehydrogenase
MTTDPLELPPEGLVERVRAITPLIASTSFAAEAQRRPLDEVIEALKATGVFRSFVPARYGGYEIDMSTYVDIGLAVAHADPSMGWVTTFYMEHNWLLTLFAEELQDEIFRAQPFVLAPGTVNPSGHAVPLDDGAYTLTGHWQFATGICHADWVLLSGKVDGDETGAARQFLVTVDDVIVKDTWYVDGMVATGSHDVAATDVMVPARRVSLAPPPHLLARPGAPYLLRIPILPFLSLTAAIPAVGAATRALELFEELVFDRVQFGTRRTQSNRVPTQVRLANLRVEVDFAETLLRDIASRIQAHADGAIDFDLPAQQQLRLAIAHVVQRCRDVIREIVASSGASVHYLDHELQRLHRDIHMISAHTVFDVDLVAEGVGRAIVAAREGGSRPD